MSEEYIKRGDAIKASTPAFRNAFSDWEVGWIESKDDTKDMIENLPSEDVAPVRHGRWVDKGTITDEKAEVITEWQSARCTYCNKYHTTPYLYYFDNFTYCPNCGAKMDEEEEA